MFGSEAASVPGLLLGAIENSLPLVSAPHLIASRAEIQKTVAALGVDAIATATEGSLQGPSLVSLKKLAARSVCTCAFGQLFHNSDPAHRFAVLASQEPRAGPGSSVLPQMHSIYFKLVASTP